MKVERQHDFRTVASQASLLGCVHPESDPSAPPKKEEKAFTLTDSHCIADLLNY